MIKKTVRSAHVQSCIICGGAVVPGTRYCGGDRGCQDNNKPKDL